MLDAHVLVLNKSWIAINVASARRSLALLYQGHARVIHPEDYSLHGFDAWCTYSRKACMKNEDLPMVRTPSQFIVLPEVILLNAFNGFIRHEIRFSRSNIFTRDKHQCQYCGSRPERRDLTLDHVLPRSRGGVDSWENLVLACAHCNVKKSNRTPEEANMRLLNKPRAPRWLPRFGMSERKPEMHSWHRFVDTSCWVTEVAE
jgi:5-methylcytosine-specific restriction endonuclease McrA